MLNHTPYNTVYHRSASVANDFSNHLYVIINDNNWILNRLQIEQYYTYRIFLPLIFTDIYCMGCTFTKYNKNTMHIMHPVKIGVKNHR